MGGIFATYYLQQSQQHSLLSVHRPLTIDTVAFDGKPCEQDSFIAFAQCEQILTTSRAIVLVHSRNTDAN